MAGGSHPKEVKPEFFIHEQSRPKQPKSGSGFMNDPEKTSVVYCGVFATRS